ncbi:MAG: hypothetical protein ACC645_22015 [Pirellulales bacterium]
MCLAVAVLVAAVGLRVAASCNALWLDEIWSLLLAEQVESPLEILTRFRVDNNHILNTFSLYWIGPGKPWIVYRLPAIIAGSLSVIAAAWIGARWGRVEKWTAMVLVAFSYLLIHYASEARGYALVVLLAFTCYESLRRHLDGGRLKWGLLFAVCAATGMLAHPMFAFCYLAAVYWSLTSWLTQRMAWRGIAIHGAICHGLPFSCGSLLYVFHLRGVELGGGPEYSFPNLLIETGSLALGGPQGGIAALLVSLIFGAGVVAGLRLLIRERADAWTFFFIAVVLPMIQAMVARPPFLFVRYFLISIAFGLLLCSLVLGRLFARGRSGRLAYALILLFFILGNLWHTVGLIQLGRGQYLEALAYMTTEDSSNVITISSDHDHGNRMLVEFYARDFAPARQIEYVDLAQWPQDPPGWLIIHQARVWNAPPPRTSYEVSGTRYALQRTFDCAKLSGWQWHCYRKKGSGAADKAAI